MSGAGGDGGGGLLAATRASSVTLLAALRTRLELLANELQQEKLRAMRLLLLSQLFAFCLALATILAIGLLVVLHWEDRVAILAAAAAFFFLAAAFGCYSLRNAARRNDALFAASMGELEEDIRQLKAAAGSEASAP